MAEKLAEGIHRVCIPFENIYTSAFILANGKSCIILDSGSNTYDAENYVIPEIEKLGLSPKYLVMSHSHGDHAGGLGALISAYPNAEVRAFTESEILLERFKILHTPGHADDCISVLDIRESILLTGDSLQLAGVGRYGTSITDIGAYLDTIGKIRNLSPKSIIASHDYVPLGSISRNTNAYLDECVRAIERIKAFFAKHPSLSLAEFTKLYNENHPELPPIRTDGTGWLYN